MSTIPRTMESPVRNVKYLLMLLCLAFNTACDDVSNDEFVRRVYVAAEENAKKYPDFIPGTWTFIPIHFRSMFIGRFEEAMYPRLVLDAWQRNHPDVIVRDTWANAHREGEYGFGILAVKKTQLSLENDSTRTGQKTVSEKRD